MNLLKLGEPSPAWPYIKAIAKYCKIPGTEIGLEPLTDLQDDLAQDQYQDQVKGLLQAMSVNTAQILVTIREKAQLQLQKEELRAVAEDFAEWLYLKRAANKFFFADFKGIQEGKFVPLPLDDIFVDLKAVPEERERLREEKERDLRAEFEQAEETRRQELVATFEEADNHTDLMNDTDDARTPGQMLKDPGPVVLLGGPGCGKTTLIKRLARSCALGQTGLRERFPDLPWGFPIVLPITQYVDGAGDRTMLEYVEHLIRERGGDALLSRYREHFRNGHVLLLLDGLDEVAHTGQRIAAAKAVDETAQSLDRNRLLVTARRVGYTITRLSVPAAHYILCPFSHRDISTFAEHWYVAVEKSQKRDKADLAAARQTAKELNDEIARNAGVASLATNPLMLTIIALVKHRSVELPRRRVELYRIALETLAESWNLARSLAQTRTELSVGETPRIEQTREVWSHIAYWMHSEANREISRQRLHDKLVEVLVNECDKTEFEALAIAGSYLDGATETSGLLEPRGPNTFAFVHQSFQEYLAGYRLVRPASKAGARIRQHSHAPRWHEVIRLGLGHLSITVGEKDVVSEIIDGLLNSDDPLEPYLCTSLRLALGCLTDQIGLRQQQVDAILLAVARKVSASNPLAVASLLDALKLVEVPPSASAQKELLDLTYGKNRQVRMESVRLIALAARLDPTILARLQSVLSEDNDSDVQAWAAWGLWRQGHRSLAVTKIITLGLARRSPHMSQPPDEDFKPALVKLLEDPEARVRFGAAEVLGQWGPQANALPGLVKLLEDPDADVRFEAAEVLGQWGAQASATPALVELLEDPNGSVRNRATGIRAAEVLGRWGQLPSALPALVKLLEDPEARVRVRAVAVLGQWGQKANTLPALIKLMEDPDAGVRVRAAVVLGQWGPQAVALPALVKLLKDSDAGVRGRSAATLGEWGPQPGALPMLVKLMEDPDAGVRVSAASVFGQWEWGKQPGALPALVKLLEDPDVRVRLRAAKVLGPWGPQPGALPALVKMLEDSEARVRLRGAEALGPWGPEHNALPAAIKLLEDPDANVRVRAADVLSQWGPQVGALPALVKLMADPDAGTRLRAVEVLGQWGHQSDALPALVKLLEAPATYVRVQATKVLGRWGKKDKDAGPNRVARLVLMELTGEAEPFALTTFEQRPRDNNGVADPTSRRELAKLLAPQPGDTPRQEAFRDVLFQLVWHHCATTA